MLRDGALRRRSGEALCESRSRKPFRRMLWEGASQKRSAKALYEPLREGTLVRRPGKALYKSALLALQEDSGRRRTAKTPRERASARCLAKTLQEGGRGRRFAKTLRKGAPRKRFAEAVRDGDMRRRVAKTFAKALREALRDNALRTSRRRSTNVLAHSTKAFLKGARGSRSLGAQE